MYSKKEVK